MVKPTRKIRLSLALLATFFLLAALIVPGRGASALGATSTTLPLHFLRSADCNDEIVEITGTIHLVNQTQPDGSVISHFNYQNVTGLGLTSGTRYQVTSVDHVRLAAPFPSSIQSVQSFQLISQGSGDDLQVQVLYHVTVSATGEVTASIDEFNVLCR